MVDWRMYIISDKSILMGKPVIKDTRLSVEFLLERLANGWSEKQLLENYPRLSPEALQALFAYTYECMRDGLLFSNRLKSA